MVTNDRCSPHGWTLDTLETHLSSRIDGLQARIVELNDEREDRNKERFINMKSAVDAALTSSEHAIAKAELATEKRFEGVNEFRAALQDQATSLMPRTEYTVQLTALTEKVDQNVKDVSSIRLAVSALNEHGIGKREGIGVVGSIVLGGVTLLSSTAAIGAFIVLLLRH